MVWEVAQVRNCSQSAIRIWTPCFVMKESLALQVWTYDHLSSGICIQVSRYRGSSCMHLYIQNKNSLNRDGIHHKTHDIIPDFFIVFLNITAGCCLRKGTELLLCLIRDTTTTFISYNVFAVFALRIKHSWVLSSDSPTAIYMFLLNQDILNTTSLPLENQGWLSALSMIGKKSGRE